MTKFERGESQAGQRERCATIQSKEALECAASRFHLLASVLRSLLSVRTPRHRPDLAELLDAHNLDRITLERNLRDIRWINRGLGWVAAMLRELTVTTTALGLRDFTLLDVATGSADIPLAISAWARRRDVRVTLFAADLSRPVLAVAHRHLAARAVSGIGLVCCDARQVPCPDRGIDIVTCSLALHHFSPEDAVALLRELGRITRRALIVTDLERCWPGYLGARLLAFFLRNRMTRHDAPVSVLRAYTAAELRRLAASAGLAGARVQRRFPFRLVLTWERGASPAIED